MNEKIRCSCVKFMCNLPARLANPQLAGFVASSARQRNPDSRQVHVQQRRALCVAEHRRKRGLDARNQGRKPGRQHKLRVPS